MTASLIPKPLILPGCKDNPSVNATRGPQYEKIHYCSTSLIDPAKLDTLKEKRAATPRLRKAFHRLQLAHISGFDTGEIDQARVQTAPPRA